MEKVNKYIHNIKIEPTIDDNRFVIIMAVSDMGANILYQELMSGINVSYKYTPKNHVFYLVLNTNGVYDPISIPIKLDGITKHWMNWIDASLIKEIQVKYDDKTNKVHQFQQSILL
jgi:hypothetical protein